MRIAVDGIRLFYNATGLGNYARSVVRALHAHATGVELLVLTPGSGDGRGLWHPPQGVEVLLPPPRLRGRWRRQWWRSFAMGRAAHAAGADVLHGLSHDLPHDIGRACPGVVTMHDLIYLKYPQWFTPIDRRLYDWKFRSACAAAARVIAISEATRRDLIELFGLDPQRIDVVYQPVDPRFAARVPSVRIAELRATYGLQRPYILQVGTIEPRKNALASVRALAALGTRFDGDLVLAGRPRGRYVNAVQAEARRLGLWPRVHVLANLSTDTVAALLQGATAAVYPSLAEGFGLPVLEAVTAGVPIVTSAGQPFTEAGGDAALYADPHNPEALAAALAMAIADNAVRARLAAAAPQQAARFADAAIAAALVDVYRRALA